ncbi:response regulator transcription factor [Paenibacillus arenilitoris]|uniref:Response regulator transcription factor n=1 Tax=Paenibacillus arenilitoris TaxID=2772299 RepID=A0A927H7P8_9BACL|nr:response regulator transcription factor [Paenibacillus arenilitoris]MBD2869809.1 response regulator transcription factor [Paenibacillus arenilitoris]
MYKVLLVDDERIIVEGISRTVDWEAHRTELIGTARNGLEALSFIETHMPDIVISDIKMPGMNGLQLVEKVNERFPHIAFILLSGFSEFDYARTAMQFGVKHYLLKPCNENTITQALAEIILDLEKLQSQENFMANIQKELTKVLPHAKEQFLKELVTNKTYGQRDWDDYRQMFRMTVENDSVRLLLFQLEGKFEFEHMFAIKNIAEDVLGKSTVLLSTTIGKHVLLLIKADGESDALFANLSEIKRTFAAYYKMDATAAVSDPGPIVEARSMYRETLECLNYQFYLGEGSIITKKDIGRDDESAPGTFLYDEEPLCMHVKSGDWAFVRDELQAYFSQLADSRLDTHLSKSYVIPLYVSIVRQGSPEEINDYLQKIASFDQFQTLRAIEQFITDNAEQICLNNYRLLTRKHSSIILKMQQVVEEQLGNPDLSLGWVATEILYMNADYLGKLFKKETGDKFSNYVVKLRIEKAMEEIEKTGDVKVFELAEQLGFGDNPQYFSQVFKKYTGFTPSEYKRSP